MEKLITKSRNFVPACVIFALVVGIYLFTLAPSITMEDSGELITAAYTLGIPHPPGFPLYAILGKIFTYVPLGTIAWRVNFMSAFFGALTISLLYIIIDKLIKNRLIAFCFSLVLAFSQIFWSQSVIAEVYTLNTFFVCVLILLLVIWQEKKQDKYLFWFAFIYGLSLTNHTMSVLLAPAFAIYILLIDKKIIKRWRLILKMLLLFLLGLSVYLYLPLRAWQRPDLNWGPITTWHDVLAHITRAQYGDFNPLVNNYGKTGIVITFLIEIYRQFFLPTLLLAFGGAAYLWQKNRPLFYLTVGIFLLNSLGIIYLRRFGWGIGIEYTYRVYYLPAYLMVVVWLSVIISYVYEFIFRLFKDKSVMFIRFIRLLFFITLISLPISYVVANYQISDQSDFWFNYDFTKNLLESLEPNSVYYFAYDGSLQGDTELFSLVYFKKVEKLRPDVDIVSEQNFFYKDLVINVAEEYYDLSFEDRRKKFFGMISQIKDRPLYANFALTQENNEEKFYSLSNNYAFKIYPNLEEARKADLAGSFSSIRNLDDIVEINDYSTAGLAAHYYYNLAAFYLTKDKKDLSQNYLIKAFNLDTAPFNHEYRRFLDYRADWNSINQ